MNLTEHLNCVVQLAEVGGAFSKRDTRPYRAFGFGKSGISFIGENLIKYNASLSALHQAERSIVETYSLKNFESKMLHFLDKKFLTKIAVSADEQKVFFAELLAAPIKKILVLRNVFGLCMEDLRAPFKLGPFTIYHFQSHKNELTSQFNNPNDAVWNGTEPNYLVGLTILAREADMAIEKADLLFEKFELAIKFAIGHDSERFEVGVLNYRGSRRDSAFTFGEDGSISSLHNRRGASEDIPIDNPFFSDSSTGFDLIWSWLASSKTTELQKRLLLAIEWIGQSYSEISPASAFLKSAIALEILFTHDQKTIINSSILSQISENVALLLGDDLETRLGIEREVKKLYSMRSAIAHAGKMEVTQESLLSIFKISRSVVIKLLTNRTLRDLKSISDIYDITWLVA
jgi:hypothetical protein